jgi:hypothetical protein
VLACLHFLVFPDFLKSLQIITKFYKILQNFYFVQYVEIFLVGTAHQRGIPMSSMISLTQSLLDRHFLFGIITPAFQELHILASTSLNSINDLLSNHLNLGHL